MEPFRKEVRLTHVVKNWIFTFAHNSFKAEKHQVSVDTAILGEHVGLQHLTFHICSPRSFTAPEATPIFLFDPNTKPPSPLLTLSVESPHQLPSSTKLLQSAPTQRKQKNQSTNNQLTCQTSNPTPTSFGPPDAYATALFSHAYSSLAVSNSTCTFGAWPFSNTSTVALSSVCSVYSASGLKTPARLVRPQSRPDPIVPACGWRTGLVL